MKCKLQLISLCAAVLFAVSPFAAISDTTEVDSSNFSAKDNFGNSIIDQAAVVSSSSGSNSTSSKVRKESSEYVSCAKQIEQRLTNGQSKRRAEYYFRDKKTGKSKKVVFYTHYDANDKVIKTEMTVTGDPSVTWHGKNPPIGEGKKSAGGAKDLGGAAFGTAMTAGAIFAYQVTKAYEQVSEDIVTAVKKHFKTDEFYKTCKWKTIEITSVDAPSPTTGGKTMADVEVLYTHTDEEGQKWAFEDAWGLIKEPNWKPVTWAPNVIGPETK